MGYDCTQRQRPTNDFEGNAPDSSCVGVWDYYPDTGALHWSSYTKALFGLPSDAQVTYSAFISAIHPDDRERVEGEIEKALSPSGGTYAVEYRSIGITDRIERWVSIRGRVLSDTSGTPFRFLGTATDITSRTQTERRLRGLVENLTRSNQDLEHFASILAHDLKEPLRTIHSFLRLISERGLVSTPDGWDFLQYALDGAAQMKGLVDALFKYSQADFQQKIKLEALDLAVPLSQALINLRLFKEETSAAITSDPLPRVMGNVSLLTQLFQNLISNALQFRGDAPPRVHVTAERNGDAWIMSVRDNGIGFPLEDAERIFIIFQRLQGGRDTRGSGTGLATCRRIIERLGGRIWARSEPGKGATFFFLLPAHDCEPATISNRAQ